MSLFGLSANPLKEVPIGASCPPGPAREASSDWDVEAWEGDEEDMDMWR